MSSTRLTPRHYWEGWEADLTEKTVPIQTGDLYPSFKICFLFSDLKIRSFAIKTKSVSRELYCECCAGFFLNLSLEWPKKPLFPVPPPSSRKSFICSGLLKRAQAVSDSLSSPSFALNATHQRTLLEPQGC